MAEQASDNHTNDHELRELDERGLKSVSGGIAVLLMTCHDPFPRYCTYDATEAASSRIPLWNWRKTLET